MKKLPYGISNYEELINENYYYVDESKYIEKLGKYAVIAVGNGIKVTKV